MRVLFIYRFCGLGGVETAMLHRVSALARVGITAEILFAEYYGSGGRRLAEHPAVRVGLSREATLALLREPRDLITITDFPEFLDVMRDAHIATPIFLETHNSDLDELDRLYSRFGSSRISGVIVPSDFNRHLIENAGHSPRVIVLPNAVDTGSFRPRAAADLPDHLRRWCEAPLMLWVGRMEEHKNPADFVAMAGGVVERRPDARFLMIGDTWDREAYRTYCDSLRARTTGPLSERLHFIQFVLPPEMPHYFAATAASGGCLVSTSRHESQPMIFLEAMASGCPVVSSDIAGATALLDDRHTARLYPLHDVDRLTHTVLDVIDPRYDVVRLGIATQARQLVERNHSLDVMGSAFRELIDLERERATGGTDAPLVSCIIIFRDGENFIVEAINSVLAQTYTNWELLLVDDGSVDGSTAIAKACARRDPARVQYLEHDGHANAGKSPSRNLGLQHARGEYIALLDHDDVWLPNKLTDQVAILQAHPEAAMTYGRTRYWHSWTGRAADQNRDGFTTLGVPPDTMQSPPTMVTTFLDDERTLPSSCSVLIGREAAMRVGGFEAEFTRFYDDVAFFAKIMLTMPVYVAGDCWDSYRQHADNTNATARRSGQWHPARPNRRREMLLLWMERYVASIGLTEPRLLASLAAQLAPYRSAPARNGVERYYDACLDGGLAVLRGENPDFILDDLRDEPEPDLDPQRAAEAFFDAMPRTTDIAQSEWLDVWGECADDASRFFRTLEARSGASGIARRGLALVERLIEGAFWLRTSGDAAARLVLDAERPDLVRVEISHAGTGRAYDVQLNHPRGVATAGSGLLVRFRVRADAPRQLAFGIARNEAPWDNVGLYDEIPIDTAWRAVDREFVASADCNCLRVHFDLGASDVAVEIAALSIRSLTSNARPAQEANQAAPLPTTAGIDLDGQHDTPREGKDRLARAPRRAGAIILMYHRVAELEVDPWLLGVTPAHFAEQMEVLGRSARVVSMRELASRLERGASLDGLVAITFDDGYADNLHIALPILERHGHPATVFITSGPLESRRPFWWDELETLLLLPRRLPSNLHLESAGCHQVWELGASAELDDESRTVHHGWHAPDTPPTPRHEAYVDLWRLLQSLPAARQEGILEALRQWTGMPARSRPAHRTLAPTELARLASHALIEIGVHTVTHPLLTALGTDEQRREIEECRTTIASITGQSPSGLTYPFGACDATTVAITSGCGLRYACGTHPALAEPQANRHNMPRFHVADWSGEMFSEQIARWRTSIA